MPASASGLMRLHVWTGWRSAVPLHAFRACEGATLGGYPGLALLGYLAWISGLTEEVYLGVVAGLGGLGLGILWGIKRNKGVVDSLERGETSRRSWKDPSPAFNGLGIAIALLLFGWLIAANLDRTIIATWPAVLPPLLLLFGGMYSGANIVACLTLRSFQRRTAKRVQVSLDKHGLVYRAVPSAYKIKRI